MYARHSYCSMHFHLSIWQVTWAMDNIMHFSSPRASCRTNYYVLHVFVGEGEVNGAAGENKLLWSSCPDWWSNVALVQPETNDWLWLTHARERPFWHAKKRENCDANQFSVMYDWSLLGVTRMLVILKICLTPDLQVSFRQGHFSKLGLHKLGLFRHL